MLKNLHSKSIFLASKSPRRKELLESLGISFEIKLKDINEDFPSKMDIYEVAEFLATKKANAFEPKENEIFITADTVVICNEEILNKPKDKDEAEKMLNLLSDNKHEVVTGVCINSSENQVSFSEKTEVYFKPLTTEEIDFYIDNYQPFDKAGGYGIQEWVGKVGIKEIKGDYYNVVGFPLARLYSILVNL
ncbi:MAG: septum formation protein Maf [Flavobacteriales bacterium]|nr:septum formation protein Maf [Flavobacteriales bacterium]MBL6873258.1 septum formation protein Maf [Flavobacteriales bacterium]